MSRIIFHVDMDAFYASVEQRDRPELKGRAVIVGGSPEKRGVVCAASYEARRFGVRSAMPSRRARQLCPQGVFISPSMDRYRAESQAIMRILQETGAQVEQVSVDEAYLDLSSTVADVPDPALALHAAVPWAKRLKARIREERRLTASIGIAGNKLMAKLASDFQKPDGLTLIPDRDKAAFLRPLPVGVIHGVGRVTQQILQDHGIRTVGQLQDYGGDLRRLTGSFGVRLKQFAFGEDSRPLDLSDEVKSISSENTFDRDTEDRPVLRACLKEQAGEISAKLKRRMLAAATIQVKVRYSDFTTCSRQITLGDPLDEAGDIYRMGCFLLARHKLVSRPLRLIGLGASQLGERRVEQLNLPLG